MAKILSRFLSAPDATSPQDCLKNKQLKLVWKVETYVCIHLTLSTSKACKFTHPSALSYLLLMSSIVISVYALLWKMNKMIYMRMLVNIQTTSERADKKVWENNGLSGSNSDVVIANENSLDLVVFLQLRKGMVSHQSINHTLLYIILKTWILSSETILVSKTRARVSDL